VLATAEAAEAAGLTPRAHVLGYAHAGVAPEVMGIGPIPAVQKLMERTGLTVEDFDVIESNEAFAAQALAVNKGLGLDPARVNPNGGAIALGHPIGATGAILVIKALAELERTGGRTALVTMCIGGGQGIALERARPVELQMGEPVARLHQRRPLPGRRIGDACAVGCVAETDALLRIVAASRRRRRLPAEGLDLGDETEAAPRHRPDQRLPGTVVAQCRARRADPRADRGIRDDPPAPDRADQLVLRDEVPLGRHEQADEIEHLRLDGLRHSVDHQLPPRRDEFAPPETIADVVACVGNAQDQRQRDPPRLHGGP
jgi:hypothetical protein